MGIMSLSEIMDKSIDILRKYIKSLVLFTLGYGVISFAAIFLIIIIGVFSAAFAMNLSKNLVLFSALVAAALIIGITFSLSYHVGIIRIASQEFTGEKADTYRAITAAFKSILKILGIVVVSLLLFLPVIGVLAAAAYFLSLGYQASMLQYSIYEAKEILLIILIIAAVLVGIIAILAYLTWLLFSLHALAIERKGVWGSIARSFRLVRRSFWKIFGCILLFGITVYAINLSLFSLAALVMNLIYLVLRLINIRPDYLTFAAKAYTYLNWPLNLLSWLVVTPISTTMVTLLYFNQRFRKEGYDMQLRLEAIQKNEEREHGSETT